MNGQDPVDLLISKVTNVKKVSSNRWMAKCPAHDDVKNSLQITRGQDDRALLKCFANCTFTDIIGAVGLQAKDMFADDRNDISEVIYDYRDERGTLLYQVIRKKGKDFLQRRPDGRGGWVYRLDGVRRVPYRLPELLAAPLDRVVFIAEGEKDCDRLSLLRLVATTNSGGAGPGKWLPDFAPFFEGRKVVCLPDNDDAGRKHMDEVAFSLLGSAASIKVLALPNLPPKGDVSDWLNAGGGLAKLKELVDACLEWSAEAGAAEASPEPEPDPWEPISLPDLKVPDEKVQWVWEGYLPKRLKVLFTGIYKSGKTTLLSYLLKALGSGGSGGGGMSEFGGKPITPSKVLVVSEEHPLLWHMRQREMAIGPHVHVICQPFRTASDMTVWLAFLERVAAEVERGAFDLVIFDSLPNLWPVKNENDNAEVKNVAISLNAITRAGACTLLIGHHSKSAQGEFKAARGATSLMGEVDLLMEFFRLNPDDLNDTRRLLKATGRFRETPPEVVLQFMDGFGYDALGTKSDNARAERSTILFDLLPTSLPGSSVEELYKDWPYDPKPPKGALARDLNYLAREGIEVQRVEGINGKHRYWRSITNKQWGRTA